MNDMPGMFSTIVVPLDLEPHSDRAVPVAGLLACVGNLPIVLLTVASPGLPEYSDRMDLRRAAIKHRLGTWSDVVLHDNDPAHAIAAYLSTLDSPLVVMASDARGAFSSLVSASTSAGLLSAVSCAVLVVGPNVPHSWRPIRPQLHFCVEPSTPAYATLPSIARWVNTFGGATPRFIEVIQAALPLPDRDNLDEAAPVQALADELLCTSGIRAEWEVLHNADPVVGLLHFIEPNDDAVLAVTSGRWLDESRMHLHSVSRRLVHQSMKPVLIIPRVSVAAI